MWGPIPEAFQPELEERLLKSSSAAHGDNDRGTIDPFAAIQPQHLSTTPVLDFVTAANLPQRDEPTGAVYFASSIVNSDSEGELFLCFGHDDALKIWVNGVEVFDHAGGQKFVSVTKLVSAPRHRGANFILVRSRNVAEGKQRLVMAASEQLERATTYLVTESGRFLRKSVVGHASEVELIWDDLTPPPRSPIEILKNGEPLVTLRASGKDQIELSPGCYTARCSLRNGTATEDFLIDPDYRYSEKLLVTLSDLASGHQNIKADTLNRRLRLLLGAEPRQRSDPDWMRKLVFTTGEASALMSSDRDHSKSEGMHLSGFISEIDGQQQYYRIYVPPRLAMASGPLPLGIVVPTATSANRPFIESTFVARQLEADRWAALAEQSGIALLWMGYRSQPYGNATDFTHFEEVLRAVRQDYQIDDHRIYLLGTCRSGMTALMMGIRWPERFAAIALVDPICSRGSNGVFDEPLYRHFPAYQEWIAAYNPLHHVGDLRSTPILMIYDGAEPGHGTLTDATEFLQLGKSAGVNARLEQIDASILHLESWRRVTSWCQEQRRDIFDARENPRLRTSIPTLARALSKPFIAVLPTLATEASTSRRDASLVRAFLDSWKTEHFCECRTVPDREVSHQIEANYTLVLLGSADTNEVWRKKKSALPFQLDSDGVRANGKTRPARNFSCIAVCRNPTVQDKEIVLIGTTGDGCTIGKSFQPIRDGWFTYAIWSAESSPLEMATLSTSDVP